MRVGDTSAWLEWLGGSKLGRELGAALPVVEEWIVPTIVQYELTRLLTRLASGEAAEQAVGFSTTCAIVPVDTNIAVLAAGLARAHELAMADAIIDATASEHGADVLTCDAHFASLPGVVYFPKSAP